MKYAWKLMTIGALGVGLAGTSTSFSVAVGQPLSAIGRFVDSTAIAQISLEKAALNSSAKAATDDLDPTAEGREFYLSGQYAAAADAWMNAATRAAAQGDRTVQAILLNYASLAYQELNQWTQATNAIDQSFELLEGGLADGASPVFTAQLFNTKAGLEYHLGDAETALALWEQAEEYYQQAGDASGRLGSEINQAQALQTLGFYRRSRQQLEGVADTLATMPDSDLKVNGLRTLGNALQVLGDLTASLAALFESANIAIAIDSTNELSATYLSLGRTARDWGDANAAMAMFERANQAALNPADSLQADLSRLRFYVDRGDSVNSARIAVDLAQQLEVLPPSRLIIYPIILPDRLAVIASSAGQPLAYHSTPVSADTVESTLRDLLSAIHPVSDNEHRLALSQQVYDWLVGPVVESH